MENLWAQIGNWGFPMVLSIFLLVRVEKKLDDLTSAIHVLGQTIDARSGRLSAAPAPDTGRPTP